MQNKYPGLQKLSEYINVIGFLIIICSVIAALILFSNNAAGVGVAVVAGGIISGIFSLAYSRFLGLAIDQEKNQRQIIVLLGGVEEKIVSEGEEEEKETEEENA